MNAESTVFRSSRPAVVVAPGGEGARAAAWLLAWPMRLAATPMGRRLLAAAALAVVVAVRSASCTTPPTRPRAAGHLPAGRPGRRRPAEPPTPAAVSRRRPPRRCGPSGLASAGRGGRRLVGGPPAGRRRQGRSLQQRRVSATEVQVLVVAEAARVADAERLRDRPQGLVGLGCREPERPRQGRGGAGGAAELAVLSSRASPGFPWPTCPRPSAVDRQGARGQAGDAGRPQGRRGQRGASSFALSDIPRRYLGFYADAAPTCRGLTWQVLAAIGKIESDHGRSSAPGVRSGVNRFGCCAGPMQFNIRNGRPSTWDTWGTGVRAQVYDPAHAVPAAARKLCGDGLARPERIRQDPCPHVLGSAALHVALKRYNNACWYVHEVVTLAGRYTSTAPLAGPVPRPVRARPGPQQADHDHDQPRLRPQDRPGLGQARPAGPVAAGGDRRAAHHPPQLPAHGPLPVRQGHHQGLQPHRLAGGRHRHGRRAAGVAVQPAPRAPWWCGWTGSRARCGPPRSARRSRSAAAPTSPTRATRATCTSATAPSEPGAVRSRAGR